MGTKVRIVLYADTEEHARAAASAAFARIQALDEMMTDYNPESELMRLGRAGARGPQRVSPDLFRVLEQARSFSVLTGGAFDVTVGPVVSLWRQARRDRKLPDHTALERARARVGYRRIDLDSIAGTVHLRKPGMKLDLGGIAKGYAADQALAVLERVGIERALVVLGGDIRVSRPPPGENGWRIAIQQSGEEKPDGTATLLLRECAISTSGDAEQYFIMDGVRYSHIIDPRSGRALRNGVSATVIAPEATESDALATALCVLTPAEGLRLAESRNRVAALIVCNNGNHIVPHASRLLRQLLAK